MIYFHGSIINKLSMRESVFIKMGFKCDREKNAAAFESCQTLDHVIPLAPPKPELSQQVLHIWV